MNSFLSNSVHMPCQALISGRVFRHTRCRDMKPQNHLWFSITTTINKMKRKINKGMQNVSHDFYYDS